jgi:signal transduction histidine kinase
VEKPRLSVSESFIGIVIRRKKSMQLENVQSSGRYQNASLARREGLVSLLSVPLLYGGKATGTLNLYTGEPHTFSDEEVRVLSTYAELSALALEKARLYDRIVSVEEELRQSERLSALGLLAAEIAHEIRNPLTVMKMLHHSLDLDFPADDPRRTDVRIMGEKMDHLNRIVDQVLDFARSTEPRLEPVDVNQLLDDLSLLTRHKLRDQEVQFIRQLRCRPAHHHRRRHPVGAGLPESDPQRRGSHATGRPPDGALPDPATEPGHGAGHPRACALPRHRRGHDTGAEPPRVHLTAEQHQGARQRHRSGHRLWVIEQHQGKVRLWSHPGKGTTIALVLPIER